MAEASPATHAVDAGGKQVVLFRSESSFYDETGTPMMLAAFLFSMYLPLPCPVKRVAQSAALLDINRTDERKYALVICHNVAAIIQQVHFSGTPELLQPERTVHSTESPDRKRNKIASL